MAHRKQDYVFHHRLYRKPRRCIVTEEDGSKVLMDLYISHKVVSGANKPGLAKWQSAVLNEVKRPSVYEGMDKPYYYDPTTRKLYDNDGDEIPFEIITDASVSPCVGKATTPLSSSSSHTTEKSESEESEQPKKPKYTLAPGLFKPTPEYPAVHSTTGVVAIGDGKFRCRFRKTLNGCLNTGSYTEEAFKAQFDQNSITKLEKEKAHPTILQKLPAAAAKPIASPEPHAKITKIEAHEQDPHKFTVWYGVEDRRKLKMSIVVTSTDGNIDLPVIVGSVWHDDSREKFREFWTQHQSVEKKNSNNLEVHEQAKKRNAIVISDNDTEEPRKRPALAGIDLPTVTVGTSSAAKRPDPLATNSSDMAPDGQDKLAATQYWSRGKEFDILNKSTKQSDPHNFTPNVCPGNTPPTSPCQFTMSPGSSPTGEQTEFYYLNEEGIDALTRFLHGANRYEIETSPDALRIYLQDPRNLLANFRLRLTDKRNIDPDTNKKISCLCFLGMIRKYEDQTVTQFVGDWVFKHAGRKVAEDFWNIPRHFDSDVLNEDSSASSGESSLSAQPGILRDNQDGSEPHGLTTPDSPDIPATPGSSNRDFTSRLYQLPDTFEETQHALIGVKRKRDDLNKEMIRLHWRLREFAIVRIQKFFRRHSARTKVKRMRAAIKIQAIARKRMACKLRRQKADELEEAKRVAATNIQAIARSTVNRMQYQKNLPIWKKTQAAMKLANEAEHQAAEAEREARRLRDAADKALSELNKLTNL